MDKKQGSALTGPPLKKITSLEQPGTGSRLDSAPTSGTSDTFAIPSNAGITSEGERNGTTNDNTVDNDAPMRAVSEASVVNTNNLQEEESTTGISDKTLGGVPPPPPPAINSSAANPRGTALTQARSTHLLEDPKLQEILVSDIGITSLLTLLKQSVVSCRELAAFVKKTASLDGEHNAAVKKLARNTRDGLKKPEARQGTFLRQMDEIVRMNERLSDVSSTYVAALTVMHDELVELAKQMDKSRKSVKETSLRQEKNALDLETLAEKAQAKYDSLCEEYDKMLAGDGTKNKFGFKQSRTAQHEEELYKKVVGADSDYQQRVKQAQRARQELVEKLRPSNAKQLKDLISEINSALTLQLHKYANLTQTLTLNKGFIILPLPSPDNNGSSSLSKNSSLKEKVAMIDNELDLYSAVVNSNKSKPLNRKPVVYREHSSMAKAGYQSQSQTQPQSHTTNDYSSYQPPAADSNSSFRNVSEATTVSPSKPSGLIGGTTGLVVGSALPPSIAPTRSYGDRGSTTSLQTAARSESVSSNESKSKSQSQSNNEVSPESGAAGTNYPPGTTTAVSQQALPVFGTPLETLLDFEESTVPRIVYQCVQAVDNFGLEIEGIYRTNGNSAQVQEIKRMFNTNSANVDLMHPKNNINDIHSVASALKLYFRDLPDPLLTKELHRSFISAGQIENEVQRRDAVHATVNNLPDPNYTTLRYLVFHLYRVQEREPINRMSISNLAIVWGPTLMATDYSNVQEMAIQGKVIESIIYNAYVIFDSD